jgi:tetratricopeptide (TPR) repeat protein
LLSCCKLDPTNLIYRQFLRDVSREVAGAKKGGWFGSLGNLPGRTRLRSARNAGDHRKVLEHGEELICRNPADLATHLDMSSSAEALGLDALAVWLLEDARKSNPEAVSIFRALAELYERQKRFPQAISIWDKVRALEPYDPDVATRIKDLAARDTIARANFKL